MLSPESRDKILHADLCDPLPLAQALIRCPSVTPDDAGVLAVLERALQALDFKCTHLKFQDADTPDVTNLYAERGCEGPMFCFAGHVDVVPPGPLPQWTFDPFAARVEDGVLYGRGASDMKGAIAAFVAAVAVFVMSITTLPGLSVSSLQGTKKALPLTELGKS